jgi:hypothetical protein
LLFLDFWADNLADNCNWTVRKDSAIKVGRILKERRRWARLIAQRAAFRIHSYGQKCVSKAMEDKARETR